MSAVYNIIISSATGENWRKKDDAEETRQILKLKPHSQVLFVI